MNAVGLLGSRGLVRNVQHKSTDDIILAIGDNTGNLVFQRAAARLIDDPILYINPGEDAHQDMARVRKECKAIIFPAANHIDLRFNLRDIARWLRSMEHPVLVIGIGTQAPDSSPSALDNLIATFGADAGFKELVDFFREPHVQVGVRGEFTRNLLARFDVPAVITGCPSFLLNSLPFLGELLEERFQTLKNKLASGLNPRIAVTASSPYASEDELDVDRHLLKFLKHHQGIYVQQSGGVTALDLAEKRIDSAEALAWYEGRLKTGFGANDLEIFFQKQLRIFFDIDLWRDSLSACDLSIGTRYHGNALAIQSGTPAIQIAHDSRTKELCTSTNIPFIAIDALRSADTLLDLVSMIQFNGIEYDAARQVRAKVVVRMVEKAGMKPSQALLGLAASSK